MNSPSQTPIIAQRLPFLTRIKYTIIIWAFKAFVRTFFGLRKLMGNRQTGPTMTKTYPCLPSHSVRIFIPKSYKPDGPRPPLLIDVHGGGYCIGDPIMDDSNNAELAYKHGILVVSIPYRLAPLYPFPTPGKDVAALMKAVMDDESLPFDRSKPVAAIGYSAGGNLILTAPQHDNLTDRVKAAVAVYPAVNSTLGTDVRLAKGVVAPGLKHDRLHKMAHWFDFSYVPVGQDKADPLLSPAFAKRDKLPEKLLILGCEYDMLCSEAQEMAEELAKDEPGDRKELEGGRIGWEKGRIRWEFAKGMEHGFNLSPKHQTEMEKMQEGIAEWLFREVYSMRVSP